MSVLQPSPRCASGVARRIESACSGQSQPPPHPRCSSASSPAGPAGSTEGPSTGLQESEAVPGVQPSLVSQGPYASLPLPAICGRPARPCHWRPLEPPRPSEEPSRVPPSCVPPRSEPCACREGLACLLQGKGHSLRRTQSDTSFFRVQRGQPASMSQVCRVTYLACTELGW